MNQGLANYARCQCVKDLDSLEHQEVAIPSKWKDSHSLRDHGYS